METFPSRKKRSNRKTLPSTQGHSSWVPVPSKHIAFMSSQPVSNLQLSPALQSQLCTRLTCQSAHLHGKVLVRQEGAEVSCDFERFLHEPRAPAKMPCS